MRKKINHDGYKPKFKLFRQSGRVPSNLYFGYELEVQPKTRLLDHEKVVDRTDFKKQVEQIINKYPWLYAKDEYDIKGCEINTHPFNWNWWVKTLAIDYIHDIKKAGLYVDRRCGFHIHLSKAWFSRQHLIRMAKLFYANPEFIEHVSQRRKAKSLKDWTLFKNAANPWLMDEIKRDSTGEDLKDLEGRDFNDSKMCRRIVDNVYEERHIALNFCPKDTIEVRIFQGTLNPILIQAYLEFCLACALYTKTVRFSDVSVPGLKEFANSPLFPNLQSSHLMYKCLYSWRG